MIIWFFIGIILFSFISMYYTSKQKKDYINHAKGFLAKNSELINKKISYFININTEIKNIEINNNESFISVFLINKELRFFEILHCYEDDSFYSKMIDSTQFKTCINEFLNNNLSIKVFKFKGDIYLCIPLSSNICEKYLVLFKKKYTNIWNSISSKTYVPG